MAMNVASADHDDADLNSTINTTPLVDVMLVLLIIFLITVPVVIQNVVKNIPKQAFEPTVTKPENVSLSVMAINGKCAVFWQQTKVDSGDLLNRAVKKLQDEIARQGGINAPGLELPEVHIRGDVNTPYRCIGSTIFTMQQAGFVKVGFISEPPPGTAVVRL